MSNVLEYKDKLIFHPGYYIKELVEESGLTQEDFAKRLDTTPKNLSILIRGEQNLSLEIAGKLARMLGTSVDYWLNLQKAYDAGIAEMKSEEELDLERKIFKHLDYNYFRDHFGLPAFRGQVNTQIKATREFLQIASLRVLANQDLSVNFRNRYNEMSESNVVRANAMLQIAINKAMQMDAPKYNKTKFETAIDYALTLTERHKDFFPLVQNAFKESGVILVALPNLSGSKTSGATKKIGNNMMLMVNDRGMDSDIFWFTLLHEAGHIINNDLGVSFYGEASSKEDDADRFAAEKLIPSHAFQKFVDETYLFNEAVIRQFASEIQRDPGIVLGRLQREGYVAHSASALNNRLKHKYHVVM